MICLWRTAVCNICIRSFSFSVLINNFDSCWVCRSLNEWALVEWYGGKLKYWEKNVSCCHFVCHISHMEWPGPEAGALVRGQWLTAWDMAKPATGLNMLTMMGLHDFGILLIRMDTVLYLQTHITLQAISVSSSVTSGSVYFWMHFSLWKFFFILWPPFQKFHFVRNSTST